MNAIALNASMVFKTANESGCEPLTAREVVHLMQSHIGYIGWDRLNFRQAAPAWVVWENRRPL